MVADNMKAPVPKRRPTPNDVEAHRRQSKGHPPPRTSGFNPLGRLVTAPIELAKSLHPGRQQSPAAMAAFYGTVGALVLLEVIEPIVGVVIVVGHALASSRSRLGEEIGEGMDSAAE